MSITFSERLAAIREATNTSPRSTDTSATPVEYMLYLYLKTPRSSYLEYTVFFRDLYNWLSPFSFPPPSDTPARTRHYLTTTNLMRYMAGYLSLPVEELQDILKHTVYPMLEATALSGDSYEY